MTSAGQIKSSSGVGASRGVASGAVFLVREIDPVVPEFDDPEATFRQAAADVTVDLRSLRAAAQERGRDEAAEILGAQSLMAEDPMLADAVVEGLDSGLGLGAAIDHAATSLAATLAAMDDEYLAARSADVLEIATRIRHKLAGTSDAGLAGISEQVVIVARSLTAADTAQLDPDLVLGFVTEEGGPTGHVAVIARALGIPAVVGARNVLELAASAGSIAIDGETGEFVLDPDASALAEFNARSLANAALDKAAEAFRSIRVSYGERSMSVAANVGGVADIERAIASDADGVGLYRTEFLFLDRSAPPTEDEQFEVYRAAISAFSDPVVIRTLDIGGDKPATYLDTPVEENPFLGERGVRLYAKFPQLFASQVRALLRASVAGDLWVMVPMVATVDDLLEVKDVFETEAKKLAEGGVTIGDPKIGVMIEVPSAAVNATQLAKHADFFSIGTNDLTQYTLAADRTNGHLAGYSDAAHPAVLSLCQATIEGAATRGISVSVCGESAADPVTASLFAAMGVDKLSVSPPAVNRIKAMLDGLDEADMTRVLQEALEAESAGTVREIVRRTIGGASP